MKDVKTLQKWMCLVGEELILSDDDIFAVDYFAGGVPSNLTFQSQVEELSNLVRESVKTGLDTLSEVCFIGLMAYFEAFCKDHFAALINICPQLTNRLRQHNYDVSIEATDLLSLGSSLQHRAGFPEHKLGFLLAERYNFGTAKEINARYHALLLVTPFSKDEKKRFDQLLNNRNLLVHHGGVYTTKYAQQILDTASTRNTMFLDSLVITKDEVISAAAFLSEIAFKIAGTTQGSLNRFVSEHKIEQTEKGKQATEFLNYWA